MYSKTYIIVGLLLPRYPQLVFPEVLTFLRVSAANVTRLDVKDHTIAEVDVKFKEPDMLELTSKGGTIVYPLI